MDLEYDMTSMFCTRIAHNGSQAFATHIPAAELPILYGMWNECKTKNLY